MTLRSASITATGPANTSGTAAVDRRFVVALARGLEVLRAFHPGDGMLGNQEIAARTGLPKPTVSRLTYTLTRLGYLTRLDRFNTYQIAPAALTLGFSALAQIAIRQVCRPYLQALADYACASVALGARDRRAMIYLEHCVCNRALSVHLDVGSRIPIASSAMGRAFIAALPLDKRAELFAELEQRYGNDWPALQTSLEQSMDDFSRRGFVLSIGEWRGDINGVGVPLVMADGSGVYAFNCGSAAFSITADRLEHDVGPRLVHAVRSIEAVVNGGGAETEIGVSQPGCVGEKMRKLERHTNVRPTDGRRRRQVG
ncbi:MAG: IclR family transcriptional regulator [Stellaceae bacterium]